MLAVFPIMIGCVFLMPIGVARFIRTGCYNHRAAGLAVGGIPDVFVAAFTVKSLPFIWIRLVLAVVTYAAATGLDAFAAIRPVR
jgi:hypothetical protein